MNNLTLIIPAKNEKESLPQVLDELKSYNLKILIVLEKEDEETIQSTKNYNCKIVFQHGKGYGDAIITGINSVDTELFCIFNADGSFNPNELTKMLEQINITKADLVFGTRYERDCGSDDDTIHDYAEKRPSITRYKSRTSFVNKEHTPLPVFLCCLFCCCSEPIHGTEQPS